MSISVIPKMVDGVVFDPKRLKWTAGIKIRDGLVFLGAYLSKEVAEMAVDYATKAKTAQIELTSGVIYEIREYLDELDEYHSGLNNQTASAASIKE